MEMHFADIWEAVADAVPGRDAVVQGSRRVSWKDYENRAARLAGAFGEAGLGKDSKVGLFLYNGPEYLEAQFAAFKMRACPVNVNYRYLEDELLYLLDNAECEAIVFHTSLGERIEHIRERLPKLRLLIEVDDGGRSVEGALAYEDVIAKHDPAPPIERSSSDVYMLYTGGTTGMPKGVMYEIGPFCGFFFGITPGTYGIENLSAPEDIAAALPRAAEAGKLPVAMPCCPLMHGTGMWLGAIAPHIVGGTVVLLESRKLDAHEILATIVREKVACAVIVGDAFARPMLVAASEKAASGTPYDLSDWSLIISSGAMFSSELKDALLEHAPELLVLDTLGSSEGGMGRAVTTKDTKAGTAKFKLNPGTRVIDENDRDVEPGSGDIGLVALTGPMVPLGYYKDAEKSARTFREIDGSRYSIPGDMATVEADGAITLLGRGSHCINTAGEKVFPEEVEEAVKTHASVADCLVFGVPDERFGQRVVGVASLAAGAQAGGDELVAHVRTKLSAYKAPRQLVIVETVPRAPNGKADYTAAREMAAAEGVVGDG